MRAPQVYDIFIRFEDRSAELYLDLSVRFFADPELSWFWVEMAMEEKQHAGLLRYCRDANVFTTQLPDASEIQKLAALFSRLQRSILNESLTVDAAFEIAILLETSEINDIYRRLTAPIQGPQHILQKKLEISVEHHFRKLLAAAQKYGVSSGLLDRLAQLATFELPHPPLPSR